MSTASETALLGLVGVCMRGDRTVPDAIRRTLRAEAVRRHRLVGLAFSVGLDEFRDDFIRSALASELWKQGLQDVLRAFSDAGIDACRLKGCAYFLDLYSDPAHRSMGDLDILVRDADFASAANVLRELGYTARTVKDFTHAPTHHALTFDRKALTVDLHRNMMQAGRSAIDLEGIWERADLARCRPAPEDEIALHIAHLVRSELMVPLASFVDLSLLLQSAGLSRARLLAHCDAFRIGRGARVVLALHDALRRGAKGRGTPFPLPSAQELARGGDLPRLRVLLAKAYLVEGPRELWGLAQTTLRERTSTWQGR